MRRGNKMVIQKIISIIAGSIIVWLIWLTMTSLMLTIVNYAEVIMGDKLVYAGLISMFVVMTLFELTR